MMTTLVPDSLAPFRTLDEMLAEAMPTIARHAARHDAEGTFVDEAYAALKSAGFLAAAVPLELGGGGAGLPEMAWAHHDLALACGSTSLAASMHSHSVVTLAWRYRRGAPVDKTLRRVAAENLVLVSTGGSDHVRPSAVARPAEGGLVVSGRKIFASQSPVGDVLATWAVLEGEQPEIVGVSIPMNAPGVEILPTWDAHGMRGTGSNDILLNDVFVPEAAVGARRPYGRLDPLIRIALINGLAIITGTYLGLVRAARDEAVRAWAGRQPSPGTQHLVGTVAHEYEAARLAFEGALARLGPDPESTFENFLAVQHAKRAVSTHGARAIEAAFEAIGGRAFYRSSPLERIARDFRGINHHPLTPEAFTRYAGHVALGGDPELLEGAG